MSTKKCPFCAEEINEEAKKCRFCGEFLDKEENCMTENEPKKEIDPNTKLMLEIESKKKKGIIAALLNLVIPGVGYMYCGMWIIGILVLIITILLISTVGVIGLPLIVIFFIDGFLASSRYNKKLIQKELKNASQ